MGIYDGGIIINGRQFFRNRTVVPITIENKSIDTMADGSTRIQHGWKKRGIKGGIDSLPQADLEFLLEAKQHVMEVEYFEEGGTEFKKDLFFCHEWGELTIRDWDIKTSEIVPMYTDITFTFEAIESEEGQNAEEPL